MEIANIDGHVHPWLTDRYVDRYAPTPTIASVANERMPAVPMTRLHIRLIVP